jgi:hypothetical protein
MLNHRRLKLQQSENSIFFFSKITKMVVWGFSRTDIDKIWHQKLFDDCWATPRPFDRHAVNVRNISFDHRS